MTLSHTLFCKVFFIIFFVHNGKARTLTAILDTEEDGPHCPHAIGTTDNIPGVGENGPHVTGSTTDIPDAGENSPQATGTTTTGVNNVGVNGPAAGSWIQQDPKSPFIQV